MLRTDGDAGAKSAAGMVAAGSAEGGGPAVPVQTLRLTATHRRRLREIWRSAGWPCQDVLEAELLAAGLLMRVADGQGRDTLRVTDAGVAVLADTLQRNRRVRDAHEDLVERVAREMQRAGRIVWRGLSLRAPVPAAVVDEGHEAGTFDDVARSLAESGPDGRLDLLAGLQGRQGLPEHPVKPGGSVGGEGAGAGLAPEPGGARPVRWAVAMPDVYSIRHTTVEDYAEPIVHEIKVRRADFLSEMRKPAKSAAYLALSSQCWFVLQEGIADLSEVPPSFGVLWAGPSGGLQLGRPAPRRPMRISFAVWMSLARATALPPEEDPPQAALIAMP